jgi:hypothetical protein
MGNNNVPPSKANGIVNREIPISTILADEAILLITRTATKNDAEISRYRKEETPLFCDREDLFTRTPVFLRQVSWDTANYK